MSEKLPKPNFRSFIAPDEDLAHVKSIYAALVAELKPSTYLEARQIELIVLCDLEMSRHRRLSVSHLASSSRTFEERAVQKRLQAQEEDADGQDLPPIDPQEMHQIVARAYALNIETHAYHDASVAKLEARRRSLLRDYDALKQRAARRPIEDAEVIDAASVDLGEA
ncbi:hypothetical protein [Roseicyclus marinus]|uniref:hypothetical protein n=1 Tax=Roseicyclus marinus TaxID=2161673 RepID=UPI00240F2A4F|nr:hypothetical protein [Roseicyclus marinus]MDG3042439.1 hypothetical protein [Roseicyclus marinus]